MIQFVPYGRDHSNPPVKGEPSWDSPETRTLVERACFDCHSNETDWPWYSHIAPASWLVQRDVMEGRKALNVSEWPQNGDEASEAAEAVQEGEMPIAIYTWLHSEARLSDAERQRLVQGLRATFGTEASRE
ncbi:MAG: heme-binding domain-containing protein [Candidatus Bipolaricaulia bacterium]